MQKALKKAVPLTLVILLTVALFTFAQCTFSETTGNPTNLNIYTGAPTILADNNTYQYIFVQLQNSSGKPTRAPEDTTVDLSSSLTSIGSVESPITIKKGESLAAAYFTSTFTPGTTAISASATGYPTVMANVTTVGPLPSALGIYGIPSTLPSDGGSYEAIMVQLQDSTGVPARAPQGGVNVALTSSDTTVGTVSLNVTINKGQTYAKANFTTTLKAATEAKIQNTTITAVSQGYTPGQMTITTTPIASNPTKLKIFSGPLQTPADAGSYEQVAIQLQNASGYAATKNSITTVNLASNDDSVCRIPEITIPPQKTYASATLTTTYKAGSANITAVANDFPLTTQSVKTSGFVPSKLVVYCFPTLPSDGATYKTVHVQLQNAQGQPARASETNVRVNLFSSQSTIGSVSATMTIPAGQTQATANFTTTYQPGTTIITAQASGYTTGQTTLTSCAIDRYEIISEAFGNGTISPNGSVVVNIGSNQTFNMAAKNGYHISDVLVDDVSQGPILSYTFTNSISAHTIVAQFSINAYNITVSQTANGLITPGTCAVSHGESPEFTIMPNTGYSISKIMANGQSVTVNSPSNQTYRFSSITSNASLTALFEPNKFTIEVIQTANGAISPGTTILNYNDNQAYTITPKTGYHIVDVLVNGTSVGFVSSYTLRNINASFTIKATYQANPTATPSPSSTPAPSPTGTPTVAPSKTPSPTPTESSSPDTSPSPDPTTAPTSSDFFASIPMSVRYALAAALAIISAAMAFIIKKKTAGDKLFEMPA
jgi:hypothetical protein